MGTVLIVDDVEDLRYSLGKVVRRQGHAVLEAATGMEALEIARSSVVDLVFLDIGLPDGDGIGLITRLKEITADVDIVMLTGCNEAMTAVQSLREGAVDYIVKPFETIEFVTILNRIMHSRLMSRQMQLAPQAISMDTIIGTSRAMLQVKEQIGAAAQVDAPVLITGETGTGKELAARAIHAARKTSGGVFVKVDCGTLSANLVEDELFGHEKGAFTDALRDKRGLVEIASGGTLFLDEIGNLPLGLQPKLLRLIEESTFRKVGGVKDITVKLRLIAATNADLGEEVRVGRFREDLWYRLNVIPVTLPPLRKRGQDILLLAESFLRANAAELKKEFKGIAPSTAAAMLDYHWPGNIRELRNLIEREVLFSRSEWLTTSALRARTAQAADGEELVSLREMERRYIAKVLEATGNNKSQAARILGISRTTLRDKTG